MTMTDVRELELDNMTTDQARINAKAYIEAAVADHSFGSLEDLSRRASDDFVAALTVEGQAVLAFAMEQIDALMLCHCGSAV